MESSATSNLKIRLRLIKENKEAKYHFLISNTDRVSRAGTHQCEILDIYPKNELFIFDMFGGVLGLKHFLVQHDQEITEKILLGIKKMKKKKKRINYKLTLVKINFSIKSYNALINVFHSAIHSSIVKKNKNVTKQNMSRRTRS